MNEPVLKKAMDTLEFLSQDAEFHRLYEGRQKFLHDQASMLEVAFAEGENPAGRLVEKKGQTK